MRDIDARIFELIRNKGVQAGHELIKRAKQEWEATADSLAELICLVDRQGHIIRANRTVETWNLGTVRDVKGENLHDLFHPNCPAASCFLENFLYQAWGELPLGNSSMCEFRDRVLGRYIRVQVRQIASMPINKEDLAESFAVIVVYDITERKQLEAQLQEANRALEEAHHRAEKKAKEADQANKAKSTFLAAMSHDIRTPMSSVIGILELLLETELTQEQREYLNIIQSSSQSLLQLLNDILDFSRIEAGQLHLEYATFDLEASMITIVNTMASRAHSKGIEFFWEIDPNVPYHLIGDSLRLQEVVTNLIGNAIKFTDHGEVVLHVVRNTDISNKTHSEEVELHFSIRDTGIGISEEQQQEIFEAFTQADSSIARKFGGTGLGLAIARNLVELMHGTLWVESDTEQGSTFHFTCRFGVQTDLNIQKPHIPSKVSLPEVSALIVEDNRTHRKILRSLLQAWGVHVTEAVNGTEGLQIIQEAREQGRYYEFLLLDSHMPDMAGLDMLQTLQEESLIKRMILMFPNDSTYREERASYQEFGPSAYLTKPINPSLLLNTIVSLLQNFSERRGVSEAPPQVSGELSSDDIALASLPKLHVLVAEDNEVNQMIVEKWLQRRDWEVTTVNNGEEVLEAIELQAFDLILMDIQMPKIDGISATKMIRERERHTGKHIPIIALTAHAIGGDKERFIHSGMDAYVAKSLSSSQLYSIIEGCVLGRSSESFLEPVFPNPFSGEILLDFEELLFNFDHDTGFVEELLTTYLERSAPELFMSLRLAVQNKDLELLEETAHRLKGAAGIIGATQVYIAAETLEEIGRQEKETDAHQALQNLEQHMQALEQYIKEHRTRYLRN